MRARLVLVALAATTMVALAFLAPLAILVRDLAVDRELSAAERNAGAIARLVAAVGSDAAGGLVGTVLTGSGDFDGRPTSIVLPDGSVVGDRLADGEDISSALEGSTFRQPVPGGEAVYVPVLGADGQTSVVRTVASSEAMREGVTRIWLTLGMLGILLVLVAVAVADRLGRAVVRPVDELAAGADRLAAGDLETRVEVNEPKELRRVGSAFNRLAAQIRTLLQREREAAADLSHRLRTPLTAARLNIDALPDDDHRERLARDIDEIERVVDHIISETRRPDRQARSVGADVSAVLADRVAFWQVLAADEGRLFESGLDAGPTMVALPESDLVAAFDAVIGNVFSHTPAGVDLRVMAIRDGAVVEVSVEDAGSGFADTELVLERGASGKGSTGLGLDIARRTAESSGGRLTVGRSALGGARVVMRFPLEA